jgi:fatty acid-binding protein DegV
MNWGYIAARFISAVGSWIDAANLRNRVYSLQQENARLRLALEDVERMDQGGRISKYARRVLGTVDTK